jgi:hypothetical protein
MNKIKLRTYQEFGIWSLEFGYNIAVVIQWYKITVTNSVGLLQYLIPDFVIIPIPCYKFPIKKLLHKEWHPGYILKRHTRASHHCTQRVICYMYW